MVKKVIVFLLCIFLTACDYTTNIYDRIEQKLNEDTLLNVRQNNFAKYIDYYIPSDLREDSATETSYVFYNEYCRITMNINIANIINNKYYPEDVTYDEGFFNDDNLVYSKRGIYLDFAEKEVNYLFKIYEYEKRYILALNSQEVNIYAYTDYDNILFTTDRIMLIAKGASVDKSAVINSYSSKDVVDYKKNQIDLFNNSFPVAGRIDDLLIEQNNETTEE